MILGTRFIYEKFLYVQKLIDNIINLHKPRNILDIGCGTGKILESLPAVDYYGYDISKKYINYAKKKYKSRKIYKN